MMVAQGLAQISRARHIPIFFHKFHHELSTHSCSGMPGGEGIVYFIFEAYLLYVVLLFIVAIVSAKVRANRVGANPARIWLVHIVVATVATASLPVFLAVDQHRALRSLAQTHREIADFDASTSKIEFNPRQVSHALDMAIARLPPRNPYTAR